MAKKRSIRQPAGRSNPFVSVRAHTQEGERRTLVKIHGKRAKTPKAVPIVPSGPAVKKLAALTRLREERRYLRGLLNAPGRWLPFIGGRGKGLDPQSALDRIRGRMAAIRQMEAKGEGKLPTGIRQPTQAMTWLAEQAEAGRQRIYGNVDYASSQWCYLPDAGGPTSNCPVVGYLLGETPEGIPYWEPVWPGGNQPASTPSHAAGFAAYQESRRGLTDLILVKGGFLWFVPCFEFRFPAPPWDCALAWELTVSVVFQCEIDADDGSIHFDPYFLAQPKRGAFPGFEEMIYANQKYRIDESLPPNVARSVPFQLSGGFSVKARTESSLYVGLSIYICVWDGCVGISSCSQGKRADINDPLWNMGLVEVLWDTGSSGIHRYRHGVKYQMIPY